MQVPATDRAMLVQYLDGKLTIGDPVLILFNSAPLATNLDPRSMQAQTSLSVLALTFAGWLVGPGGPTHIRVTNRDGVEYLFDLGLVSIGLPAKEERLVG